MASSLAEIARKLAEARKHEASEANWSNISYAMNPPAGRAAVEQLELAHGVTLPADYRAFLLEIGDGGAGPGYGLYPVEKAFEEYGEGVWSLADPFVPPRDSRDWIDFRAPGMLPVHYDGCSYYGGLVLSGPERGTMWSYVEVKPGWIPQLRPGLVGAGGEPYVMSGGDVEDYQAWYDAMLLPANRKLRMSFLDAYEDWLDGVIRQATTS